MLSSNFTPQTSDLKTETSKSVNSQRQRSMKTDKQKFIAPNDERSVNSLSTNQNASGNRKKERKQRPAAESRLLPPLSTAALRNRHNIGKAKAKSLEPMINVSTTFSAHSRLYKFTAREADYNKLCESHPRLKVTKTKFYINTEHKGVGHLDSLFSSFCVGMKMASVKNLPMDGEKVFCWLGKRKAREILPYLKQDHHFVNRLPLDVYLKDKQTMATTLKQHVFKQNVYYKRHWCPYKQTRLPLQIICVHQYSNHSFDHCSEPKCYEAKLKVSQDYHEGATVHKGEHCPCFIKNFFVPETRVFSSAADQQNFIADAHHFAPQSQWVAKPAYMRGGRGVRILSSVNQVTNFFKMDFTKRNIWGQNYVVQRYIDNPLLTNLGHKFDIRMFLLVIVCKYRRVVGFVHPGYIRKAPCPYQRMEANESYRAKFHLASTRVWQKYAPPEKPTKTKNRQNGDFFSQDFQHDECEDYNYAVKLGCLQHCQLPQLNGTAKVPTLTLKENHEEAGKDDEETEQFWTKHKFLWFIDTIIKNICTNIQPIIQDKSNCYQIFSLDICVDKSGKPWLLEINPSMITENVNFRSATIKEIVPAILYESLGLVIECTRKSLEFLALRMPRNPADTTRDLIFRENFIWLYSTNYFRCYWQDMVKLKAEIELKHKHELTRNGTEYMPVDYLTEMNNPKNRPTLDSSKTRSNYPFPTPVADVPAIEDDIRATYRYQSKPLNTLQQELFARRMQSELKEKLKKKRRRHQILLKEKKFKMRKRFFRID